MRHYNVKVKSSYIKGKRALRIKALKDKFGAKCFICGYDKNYASLDFHHLRDKLFGISTVGMDKPLECVENEAKKCVLLCRNCHSDVHHPTFSRYPEETLAGINKLPIQKETLKPKEYEFFDLLK
jgi:5-methylcytosine-specific restriction endonuclease McrA